MKERLVELVACPACHSSLALKGEQVVDHEIMEGTLACRCCRASYPVIGVSLASFRRGVRRELWLPVERVSERAARFRDWGLRVRAGLRVDDGDDRGGPQRARGPRRWRWRRSLCRCCLSFGGEVVGVDITRAVDAAFSNIGRRAGVHIVQADIFALPFGDEVFDVAYSIGVLHHTPDPARAFLCVTRTLKVDGIMAVYVYAAMGIARHFSDTWRKLTTKLPSRLMFYAAASAVPLYHVYRAPLLGRPLQTVAPISMHPKWQWRWLDTFDWYTPEFQFKCTYSEVWRWFDQAGFDSIRILNEPICMQGTKRKRKAGALEPIIDTSA